MNQNLCVNGIYSSKMVLQQNAYSIISGKALPNQKIVFTFKNIKRSAISDKNGDWAIKFNPGKACQNGTITVSCQNEKITFTDVATGEVWLASGQSNSELPMNRMFYSYQKEFSECKNPLIKIATIPVSYSFEGEKKFIKENIEWKSPDSKNIGSISGTSYFFAKYLSEELKIPVGIINASQGGSPISSWMSKKSLKKLGKNEYLEELSECKNPENLEKMRQNAKNLQNEWDSEIQKKDEGIKNHWEKLEYSECENSWENFLIPGIYEKIQTAGILWLKKKIILSKEQSKEFNKSQANLWLGTMIDSDTTWVNSVQVGNTGYSYPPRRYKIPQGILHEGENTITIRAECNGNLGKMRWFSEKPYYLFTDENKIVPCANSNFERHENQIKNPENVISLSGEWKCKIGAIMNVSRENELFFEWKPTALYNKMLSPLFRIAIRGVLWYQGESNASKFFEYRELLTELAFSWKKNFQKPNKKLPFIVVQLPNWSDGFKRESLQIHSQWAELRQAQSQAVSKIPDSELVVTIDSGEWNDLHPEKKLTVGKRAALSALSLVYHKKNSLSPEISKIKISGKKAKIQFKTNSSELKAFLVKDFLADFSKTTDEIFGFSVLVQNEDKILFVKEVPAKIISKNCVEVTFCEGLIKELRYLWCDCPECVNFYNADFMPVPPFKIEF